MKAVIINEHGDYHKLKYVNDFAKPQFNADEVLVEIKATSINRADLVIRNGYPGLQIPLPHILGGDIVGVISERGASVTDFNIGDRVIVLPVVTINRSPESISRFELPEHDHLSLDWKYFGMHINGSYAEYAAVPAKNLVKLPNNVPFEDATAFGVAGLTAYHAIVGVGKLQAGEVFFIWGGSGGLGTIAIQIAKAIGCKVITTCGSESKKETLLNLGADYVFNHHADDVPNEVKKIFPFGVDAIIDYIGPATFSQSFVMLKKGGRMMLCGILTGRETNISLHQTYLRHLSIHGLYLGTKTELQDLIKMASEGKVKAHIGEIFPLEKAASAHQLLESGKSTGKIVLKV